MGRLKDWAFKPFDKSRYKGVTVPDYVEDLSGFGPPAVTVSRPGNALQKQKYSTGAAQKVVIDNGFWAGLMPRSQPAIDYTDIWEWDWDTLISGPVTVVERRVPYGLAWHIDNMYFFVNAIGGVGGIGTIMLPPAAVADWLIIRVFVSSSQLKYEAWEGLLNQFADPKVSFPFLNDRIGPREAKFGVTLYEGETIRATVQTRLQPNPLPPEPPPYAIRGVGFRFMGIEAPKLEMDDYLQRKKWHA